MTLDEAIEYYKTLVAKYEEHVKTLDLHDPYEASVAETEIARAMDCQQIVDWLKELKSWRKHGNGGKQ